MSTDPLQNTFQIIPLYFNLSAQEYMSPSEMNNFSII